MSNDQNFFLFEGPKWLQNWASEARILHTSKSSSNEHITQDQCEIQLKLFDNIVDNQKFHLFGAQNDQ